MSNHPTFANKIDVCHAGRKTEKNKIMVIQFSHNGKELNLSRKESKDYKFDSNSSGYRFWNNTQEHKRKFMKHKGWFLENLGNEFSTKPKEAELYFWGEWEPQSRFELTGNSFSSKERLPHAIHYPIFSTKGIGCHNTDPFVFGDYFYYTNCKQKQFGRGKNMLTLSKDSIIIFGSEINKSDFIIDTVFVVSENETVEEYKKHPNNYPQILRQATIDLNGGLQNWHKLYKGKMYDFENHYSENNKYAFCFFPCKIDCGNNGFERPIINWRKFRFQEPGAGTVLYRINPNPDFEYWNALVAELVAQGFSLGIKLDFPPIENNVTFPEYENKDRNCGKFC